MEDTYSILAWPNGCSLSAGFAAILKLTKDIIDDPASERLLSASAIIAIENESIPATSLIAASIRLVIIPTMLENTPYLSRTDTSSGLV